MNFKISIQIMYKTYQNNSSIITKLKILPLTQTNF